MKSKPAKDKKQQKFLLRKGYGNKNEKGVDHSTLLTCCHCAVLHPCLPGRGLRSRKSPPRGKSQFWSHSGTVVPCGLRGQGASDISQIQIASPHPCNSTYTSTHKSALIFSEKSPSFKIIFIGLVCKKSSDHDSMPYAHDCCILLLKQGQLAESRAVNFLSTQEE
jgi:hypothetical protein